MRRAKKNLSSAENALNTRILRELLRTAYKNRDWQVRETRNGVSVTLKVTKVTGPELLARMDKLKV